MAKFCTNCGASLADAAKFCNGCGTKQDDAPPVQQPQQQQPVQQQPVQQQPIQQPVQQAYQQPAAPALKKKKSKLPIILLILGIIAVGIVLGVILIFNGVLGVLSDTAKADHYEMGKDRIPSVKYVLSEERKVTGVNSSINGKATSKEIIYELSGPERRDELYKYYKYLVEKDGFYNLNQIDFDSENKGSVVIGRNSIDDGYEIQIQLKYDTDGYTVTILKQPGGITPKEEENADPVDSNQTPDPNGGGALNADPIQTPAPKDSTLTEGIMKIFGSGSFHMKIMSEGTEVESYIKNGMTAMLMTVEDTDIRMVLRDNKSYTIFDSEKMLMISDASNGYDFSGLGETSSLTYISEGSGDFNGRTYKYDEYRDINGSQIFYYVDGGSLKGIRTVENGETVDIEIISFDGNVPDSVFDIPSDYEVM